MNYSKQTVEKPSITEQKTLKAVLTNKEIVISAQESIDELAARGYGTKQDKKLALTLYEALFLLSRNVIEIQQKGKAKKKIGFEQLLGEYKSVDPNAWTKYLIYRDLRSRGYVTREGFGLGTDFRVYERGEYGSAAAKYLIFGFQEGQPVTMEQLGQTLRYAHSQKKELVLAVLNRRGEVVYYQVGQLTLRKKQLGSDN